MLFDDFKKMNYKCYNVLSESKYRQLLNEYMIKIHTDNYDSLKDTSKNFLSKFVQAIYFRDTNNSDDLMKHFMFATYMSAQKLIPKRESTPNMSDILINANAAGLDCFQSTQFFWGNKKMFMRRINDGNDYDTTFNFRHSATLYVLSLDIDDFPLAEYATEKEALSAILEYYPIFNIIVPNYIYDSGNKGFHVDFLFNENIANNVFMIKNILSLISNYIGSDKRKNSAGTIMRLPYLINHSTGNLCRMVLDNSDDSQRYSFYGFCTKVINYFKNQVAVIDNSGLPVFLNKNVFEETYCDYDDNNNVYLYPESVEVKNVYEYAIDRQWIKTFTYDMDNKIISRNSSKSFTEKQFKAPRKGFKYIAEEIIRMLDMSIAYYNNHITGMRNSFVLCYASAMYQAGYSMEDCANAILKRNMQLIQPLDYGEIMSTVRTVYKYKYVISFNMLENYILIPEEVKNRTFLLIGKSEKVRKSIYNKRAYKHSKKGNTAKRKKDKVNSIRYKLIWEIYNNKKIDVRRLSSKCKYSVRTILRWIKSIKACLNIKKTQGFNPIRAIRDLVIKFEEKIYKNSQLQEVRTLFLSP